MLGELRAHVLRAASELSDGSEWGPTLETFEAELKEGQPFFLRFALASSSKSIRETPVVSE